MAPKTVIIIGGPTAVGKTAVAIEVARHFKTRIISADSRQCYREMNIGVARPSREELAAVPHYFIADHTIHEKVTAATFEQFALEKARQLFLNQDVIVLVGGTGLYIKAFCEGFDPIPEVPDIIRKEVRNEYQEKGLAWLQSEVKLLDPHFFSVGEIQNPQRLMRALEVVRATGNSVVHYRKGEKANRNFRVVKIGLEIPKERLHQNINTRVDQMMAQGLLEEVRQLVPFQHLNALQTVGYRELFHHLNVNSSLEMAVAAIKQNTRQYAKRQLTWFKKDPEYQWFSPQMRNELLQHLNNALNLY